MEFKKDFSLKEYNSLELESSAKMFCDISNENEIIEAVKYANEQKLRTVILGSGTNIVLPKNLHCMILRNNLKGVIKEGRYLKVSSGENWHDFVLWTLVNDLFGLENLSLIPGTVGAAPIQNIGAYGEEIASRIVSVNTINLETLQKKIFTNDECQFSYRDSFFKKNKQYFICSIDLKLNLIDLPNTSYKSLSNFLISNNITPNNATASEVSRAVMEIRSKILPNPSVIPNVGSFFKNPFLTNSQLENLLLICAETPYFTEKNNKHKISVAYLLEKEGWKGKSYGEVGVSATHSLVLTTQKGATQKNLLNFASQIQYSIKDKYNLDLEIEPIIYN